MAYIKPLAAAVTGMAAFGLVAAGGPHMASAADDTIILGAAISLTGKYSTNGEHTKRGYDLAVKRVNEMGGVKIGDKTYDIKVVYYDDESTPARGAQLAERLISQDGVKFVLGPYSSGLTKAMAPVTEKYGIPMVEANGAARSLFDKGYRYLFAVLSTSEQYLQSAVQLAAEQAEKAGRDPSTVRIAGAFENDPFSQDIRAGVLDDAKRLGMKMVIDDKLPKELNDMTATLTKVKALRPDLLVVSGHSKGAALAIRQISDMKVDVPMLAMTHWRRRADHRQVRQGCRVHALRLAVGAVAQLSRRLFRQRQRLRQTVRGNLRLCPALPVGGISGGSAGLCRRLQARAESGSRRRARRAGRDRHANLLRQHRLRRNRQEHRQADGAVSGPGRRISRRRPDTVGRGRVASPHPAMERALIG